MTCGLPYQLLAGDIGDIAMSRVSRGAPIHQLTEAIVGIELALGRKRSMAFSIGSGIVLVFLKKKNQLCVFKSALLSVFLANCSILEPEAAISTVLQHFGVRTSQFPWYCATS